MLICDTHADTLHAMQDKGRDPALPLHITKEGLLRNAPGDVRVQALALWTGGKGLRDEDEGLIERELTQLEKLKQNGFRQITRIDDALPDAPNVLLTVEGGEVFHGGAETVDAYAALGVRVAAIVWNNENRLASPAVGGSQQGLTAYGREIVRRMNERHMAVDVSHLNEAGFRDAMACSAAPLMASHSCCRALCDHPRNLTDDQLRQLFAAGGFVGVNFYPCFLDASGKATVERVVDHIDRMLSLGGDGYVGLGSDFDGIETCPEGLEDAGKLGNLFTAMRRRGYPEKAVENVAGESFARYLSALGC